MKEVKLKEVDCVDFGRMFAIPAVILGFLFVGLPFMVAAGPHNPLPAIIGGLIVAPLAGGFLGFLYGACQAIVLNIMFACTKHGLRLRVEIPEEDYGDPFVSPSSSKPTTQYPPASVTLAKEKEKMDKEKNDYSN